MPEKFPKDGQMQCWLNFFQLLQNDSFPDENIAYQLFLDVVKFYTHRNIHAMDTLPTSINSGHWACAFSNPSSYASWVDIKDSDHCMMAKVVKS